MAQSLAEMADDYIEQIRQVRPSGPYHLIGWSPGGLVATPPLSASANRARRSAWWTSSARHRPAPRRPRRANWRRAPSSWSSWGPPTMTPAHYAPRAYPPKRRPRSFCAAATAPWLIWGSTAVYRSNSRLASGLERRSFDGDITLFAATENGTPPPPTAAHWHPYVTATVTVHPIACAHQHMTRPGPLSEIGRAPKDLLEQWAPPLPTHAA
ncbi:hypothetical protein JW613_21495 [Streptomyces smyrnaeus]|uniref:Thioesterase domain-containing protein n=1 Tax=Streptomyces smyrnaeus TaxID=1387713 RepID=A0ABS3XZL7_9ACTN|nr:hypothetical protein [Streptomyces smyrnaeus]